MSATPGVWIYAQGNPTLRANPGLGYRQEPAVPKNRITRISIATSATISLLGLGLFLPSASAMSIGVEVPVRVRAIEVDALKAVRADKTPMRCGDKDVFYTIAELRADTLVEAVGTSGAYTKIVLPESIGALVPASEVDASTGSTSLTLIVESKLRAPSHLMGLTGAWKALYANPLPTGTALKILEVLKNESGEIVGYRVIAPIAPSGELPIVYIKTSALRDATPAEIKAAQPTGSAPSPASESAPESEQAPVPVIETPPETSADTSPDTVDTSLLEEMNTQAGEASTPSTDPVEIENATPIEVDQSAQPIEPAPDPKPEPAGRRAPSGLISASALEDLEAAFDSARALNRAELDAALDELLAEFTRTRAQAQDGSSLANALDQRLEWLDIRIQTRDQRRAIAKALADYDAHADQVAKAIAAWQQGRAYMLVGRMVTSAVYTGEHLPLLYRIQITDPATGANRTLGYVAPGADQDFRHLLGRVVGVVGTKSDDQSLKLTVIEPDRIDPMPE